MDIITRTDKVRDGSIAYFEALSTEALNPFKGGQLLRLGRSKRGPFVYFNATDGLRRCTENELALIGAASEAATAAGYRLGYRQGPGGNLLCEWERIEPEDYDHPVAPTALLNGWITR